MFDCYPTLHHDAPATAWARSGTLRPAYRHALYDLRWGLERETHRLQPDGALSGSPHPEVLRGPEFTRDFAETQLEMATRPQPSLTLALRQLGQLVTTAERAIGTDVLWPFSMPPRLPAEPRIPIAHLGPNEEGRRARLYRQGLALRYGKPRQMICGVHVNVSFGPSLFALLAEESPLTREERSGGRSMDGLYLRLARNLYRDLPLLVLLLGASPVRGAEARAGGPFAISYRNSRHGYAGDEFLPYLDLESVEAYVAAVRRGLRTESAAFAPLGLVRDGRVVQLNRNVFQTEKEFYAPVRLRQGLQPGESTLRALAQRGVGYVELRFFDVDPFQRAGISQQTLRLLHLLLLDGLSRPSIGGGRTSLREDLRRASEVALLDPLNLDSPRGPAREVRTAAAARLSDLRRWAERLDAGMACTPYRECLDLHRRRITQAAELPSAVLARAFADCGTDWTSFGIQRARSWRRQRQGGTHALADARV